MSSGSMADSREQDPAPGGRSGPARALRALLERLGLAQSTLDSQVYDGFISYSHATDGKLAPALQRALVRFAKPWYLPRALRIFRDDASLSAEPLWSSIEGALSRSRYFILLASPEAARSKWVDKEVAHWLETRSAQQLLIVVTHGEAAWDDHTGDFDWANATALPPALKGVFEEEPRLVDLRLLSGEENLSLSLPEFSSAVADLAATLHGVSKEDLASEEVVQHRRTIRVARGAFAGLTALTVAAGIATVLALIARSQAIHDQQLATSRALSAQSLLALGPDPQLALLLAVASADAYRTQEALLALRAALPQNHLIRTLESAGNPVVDAAWGPRGTLIVTGNRHGGGYIWDPRTGRVVQPLPVATQYPTSVAFDRSGGWVLTWGSLQPARLWRVGTASAPVTVPGSGDVLQAAISPDDRMVAIAGPTHSYVWHIAANRLVPLGTGSVPVNNPTFSPTGSLVATTDDYHVQLWNTNNGWLMRRFSVSVSSGLLVSELAFDLHGDRLVTSTVSPDSPGGGTSQIWDVQTGRALTSVLPGGDARWSPDGKSLATTTDAGVGNIWNATTGSLSFALKPQVPIAGPIVFSPDTSYGLPQYLVSGSAAGSATVWSASTGVPIASLNGQPGQVTPAGFSPDANEALTYGSGGTTANNATGDGMARLWDSGVVQPTPGGAFALRFGANPEQLWLAADPASPVVSAGSVEPNAPALISDVRTGRTLATLPGYGASDFAFDRSGHLMLVTAGLHQPPFPPAAQLRAVRGGGLLHELPAPAADAVGGALSADGKVAITINATGLIVVWNATTGQQLASFDRFPSQVPKGESPGNTITVKLSPDGKLVLAADQSGLAFVFEARTGRILNTIHAASANAPGQLGNAGVSGAISPDNRLVVIVSSGSNDAALYRVGKPSLVLALVGHSAGIFDAAFNNDGTLIATTSPQSQQYAGDNSVRVWSTTNPQPLLTLSQGAGARVAFSSDGHSIITNGSSPFETIHCVICGGFDYLLSQAHQRETREFTQAERAQYLQG
ncbi:MAG: TIR domain-containing protein [Solirubrobacteraceae bacterium]